MDFLEKGPLDPVSRIHSEFNQVRSLLATEIFECAFNESRNRMNGTSWSSSILAHGSSSSALNPWICCISSIDPGLTITASDQCSDLLIGTNTSFFWKTLRSFWAVQRRTASTPSSWSFEKKWVVKKCTSSVSKREILDNRK